VTLRNLSACALAGLALAGVVVSDTSRVSAQRSAHSAPKYRVLFNRFQSPTMTIFMADADGKNEHPLFPPGGLEYSPRYSSDGQWILYTAERNGLADIYRMHPDGTGVERLTDHVAFDDQAALSPNGRTVAFVSTREAGTADIWLLDLASKTYTNLTRHHSGNFRPVWSPDGAWIAFSSDRDARPGTNPGMWEHLQSTGIYIVRADGTSLRRLTRKDGFAGSPSWSADGKRVLFYETDEVGAYMAKSATSRTELVSIDVTTGDRIDYTSSRETKLSPAFLSDGRISYVVRAADETAGLRIWYPSRRITTLISGAVRGPSWAPDGTHVVYEKIARLGGTEHLVATASRDNDFEIRLTDAFPAYSSDGARLVYSQYGPGRAAGAGLESSSTSDTSIEIMNADGSGKHTLFHKDGFAAFSGVFAPSGTELALSVGRYFRAPGLPPGQLALIKPDGSDFTLVVDDEVNNGFPTWSPDGRLLAFKRGKQLVIMSVADRTITPLTDGSSYDNFPQWSPRGDVIMFTSDREGDFDLYTIRPDGTGLRRLTNAPGNDAHSAWCSDGQWIVFSSARMGFKDEMARYDAVPQPYGEIFAIRADGSDARQLTDNKWEDASPACLALPAPSATAGR
jgi:TolB protein